MNREIHKRFKENNRDTAYGCDISVVAFIDYRNTEKLVDYWFQGSGRLHFIGTAIAPSLSVSNATFFSVILIYLTNLRNGDKIIFRQQKLLSVHLNIAPFPPLESG